MQKQEKWIKFSKNDITELFIGFENETDEESERNNKIPGLFQQIGDYNKNVFAAMGCLDLLEKLVNTEYNPDNMFNDKPTVKSS